MSVTKKVAKKTVTKKKVQKKAAVEHLRPSVKPKAIRKPKKNPFWDKTKGIKAFHLVASIVAGGGLPIICFNVAHVQLAQIPQGTWVWNAMLAAAIAGFIFSSLTVFDLLADWLSSKTKAFAYVIVTETVMLLGVEEWASLSVLSVLVVLNAGSTFVTLETRRVKREEALKEAEKEARRIKRNGTIRSQRVTTGRRKAS